MEIHCPACKNVVLSKGATYCSNQCQADYQYEEYIKKWKNGQVTGTRGKRTSNFSAHVVRYLKEVYGNKCQECGWNKINAHTGQSPLEIDHMDGNSSNNTLSNLTLLCPNCHSLTKTYKNLNKGHGRLWRREKYVKIGDVPP